MVDDIDAQGSVARLKRWVVDEALPLWGENRDSIRRAEAFVERLTFEGAPLHSAPRRAMVQARQIYVFSHAALLGWWPAGRSRSRSKRRTGSSTAITGSTARHGWVFSVHPDGAVHDAKRDFYAHSFALFGLAWAYKLAPEPRFLSAALDDIERSRSALRVADRRLPQRSAGRRQANANRTRTCISSRPCWHGSKPPAAKCFSPAPASSTA